jgi:hypothetical protein
MVQASSYAYWNQRPGDFHQFGRRWRVKGSVTQAVGENAHVAVRYFYMDRTQVYRPPIADATLNVIDRCVMIDSWFDGPWGLGFHVGGMRDRVTVWSDKTIPLYTPPLYTHGTRHETRVFISIQKLFGKVRVRGIEGMELDQEPYEVSFHHDKGFFQLQTAF